MEIKCLTCGTNHKLPIDSQKFFFEGSIIDLVNCPKCTEKRSIAASNELIEYRAAVQLIHSFFPKADSMTLLAELADIRDWMRLVQFC